MRNKFRSLLRDTRGSVFAETLIILPIFALILGLVIYETTKYRDVLEIRRRLRYSTWKRAYAGCEVGPQEVELFSRTRPAAQQGATAVPRRTRYFDSLVFAVVQQTAPVTLQPPKSTELPSRTLEMRHGLVCNESIRSTDTGIEQDLMDTYCRITHACSPLFP